MSDAIVEDARAALAWAHEHDGDPQTWTETCRAVHPLGAMCDLRQGHASGHYQVSDWLGRYGTCWHDLR